MNRASAALIALSALYACEPRSAIWSAPASSQAYGLANAVVLVDDPTHRLVALTTGPDQALDTQSFAVGHAVLSAQPSPDGARLFVLAAGDVPRRSQQDEPPSLSVLDMSTFAPSVARYTLAAPHGNLAIDPLGRYAAAFASSSDQHSFEENPNEIVLFDLSQPPGSNNPIARTIRSFGGRPQRLTFTPTLHLPAGPRRLLVVETDQDVTLLDLDHIADQPPRPEITVRLTNGDSAHAVAPAGVVVDDGDPSRTDDARVAVRTSNDTNIVTLQLAPSPAGAPNDFEPTINLSEVGGIPSDIAFVRTDGGLRVAALVPSTSSAVLVEPNTSVTQAVALPGAYGRLSLVTAAVGSGQTDVALLWNAASTNSGVALWSLAETTGQPYRSVEVLGLQTIGDVDDVPPPHGDLKVLETNDHLGFYVLDLKSRTAAPLTTQGAATLVVAPDGNRVWTYQKGTSQLATLDFATLHPIPLFVDRPIGAAFDIARADGGRSLVTVHGTGDVGVTVFDALAPDTATARLYSGLLLEGL